MNVELLEKIKQHILEEPKRLVMSHWYQSPERTGSGGIECIDRNTGDFSVRPFPACNTAACIAGWACILGAPERLPNIIEQDDYETNGAELLGLDYDQAQILFYRYAWPSKFTFNHEEGMYYSLDDGSEAAARQTAARIDHFIATEGAQ